LKAQGFSGLFRTLFRTSPWGTLGHKSAQFSTEMEGTGRSHRLPGTLA
jgi:hypothetical protein